MLLCLLHRLSATKLEGTAPRAPTTFLVFPEKKIKKLDFRGCRPRLSWRSCPSTSIK